MRVTLTDQIKALRRVLAILEKMHSNRASDINIEKINIQQLMLEITTAIETIKQIDLYGGVSKLKHKQNSVENYKKRYWLDDEFREKRLKYFREYYEKNKERIKLRNIKKFLGAENENIYIR